MSQSLEIGNKFYYNNGVQVEVIGEGKMQGSPAIVVHGNDAGHTFTQTHTLDYARENLKSGFWKRSRVQEKYIRSPIGSSDDDVKVKRVRVPRRFKI